MIGQVFSIIVVVTVSLYLYGLIATCGSDDDEPKKKNKRRPHKRPVKRGGVLYTWH